MNRSFRQMLSICAVLGVTGMPPLTASELDNSSAFWIKDWKLVGRVNGLDPVPPVYGSPTDLPEKLTLLPGERLFLWTHIAGTLAAVDDIEAAGTYEIIHHWLTWNGGAEWEDYRVISAGLIGNPKALRLEANGEEGAFDWRAPTNILCPKPGRYKVAIALSRKVNGKRELCTLAVFQVEILRK